MRNTRNDERGGRAIVSLFQDILRTQSSIVVFWGGEEMINDVPPRELCAIYMDLGLRLYDSSRQGKMSKGERREGGRELTSFR
jgi:hypothetical protein